MADLSQIQQFLQQKGIPYKTVKLNQRAFTVADVVKAGVNLDEVVKTLIIRVQPRSSPGLGHGRDATYVALALCGNDKVDFKKIRAKFGSKTELAKPDEVQTVVGVPIGAVCPILLNIPLYIDRRVLNLENVHMGSGDLKHGLEMKLDDLLSATFERELLEIAI